MAEYRSIKERYGHDADLLAAHRRRLMSPEPPPPDPFVPPVTHCPRCGGPIAIIRRDAQGKPYGGIEGLVLGACKPCNLKAALVERIYPIFRQGDDPAILDILARDMEESERQAAAMYSDSDDPRWQAGVY